MPKKSEGGGSQPPKKGGGKEAQQARLFDVSRVREAVAERWCDVRFRQLAIEQLKALADQPVPGGPPGIKVTKLEMLVLDVIDEIKDNFEKSMWLNTLNIVSYDLPIRAEQVIEWAEKLVAGKENEGAKEAIFKTVPKMKEHPDTENYMNQMILPFRSVVVSQVVAGLLDAAVRGGEVDDGKGAMPTPAIHPKVAATAKGAKKSNGDDDDEAPAAAKKMPGESPAEAASAPRKKKHGKLFPEHVHAAHHAKDIDDVFEILSYVPKHAKELRKHIEKQHSAKIVTRFAEYNYFYMTVGDDKTDKEWIDLLMPLAKDGLAHAQFDVGQLCLEEKREVEALAWFERASKLGHTRAMLALSKLHITKAFAAIKFMKADGGGADRVKRNTNENVKAALKWLDVLAEGDWDEDSHKDIEEGKKLLEFLEKESAAVEKANNKAKQMQVAKSMKKFWLWFGAAVCVALTAWWAFSVQRDPTLKLHSAGLEDEGPTHVHKFTKKRQ